MQVSDPYHLHFSGNERILLVDDETEILSLETQMLQKLGYEVTVSNNSKEALSIFRDNPSQFDLVITDITMPHMTGDQLARRLLAIRPALPIIACTGFSERMTQEIAEAIGIREFVMKPVILRELAQTTRKALSEKHD